MKLICLILILLFSVQFVKASDTGEGQGEDSDYNVIRHQKIAMNVLLGWSIASVATGTPLAFQKSIVLRDIGIQTVAWGGIDGAIALFGKNSAKNKMEKGYSPEKEKQSFRKILLINTLLDVVYIGVGTALAVSGKEKLKGHGYGIIVQGAFLFLFDGINLLLIP